MGTPIQRDLNARIYAPGANAAVEQAAKGAHAERWTSAGRSKGGYRQQHQGRRSDDTRCRKYARDQLRA